MSLIGSLLKLESHLKCELCHGLLNDALTLNECGHRFCRRCVFDKIGKERECPTCKLPAIVRNLQPAPMYDTLVACVRKLGTLVSEVQTVDSNALYRSLPRNSEDALPRSVSTSGTETQTPSQLRRVSSDKPTESRRQSSTSEPPLTLRRRSSTGIETQTPSLLKHGSDEGLLRNDDSGTETRPQHQLSIRLSQLETQTPSILRRSGTSSLSEGLLRNDSRTESLRKRASSESGTQTQTPSLLKRTSSEILSRDEPPRLGRRGSSEYLQNGCRSSLLPNFMPTEVELSRREAVYEETHMPTLLRDDDPCDKSQASDDSQDMVLTDPDVSDNDMFDDQDQASEASFVSLSNSDDLVKELDARNDDLPDDELSHHTLKRNLSATNNGSPKRRRTDSDDFIDPVEVICGSSQESDIMQALCDSKDDLPDDEVPRKQVEDVQSSPEDLLTAIFESKDDLPDDELPRRHDKVPQQQDKSPQKQDKSPQKQVEDVQSSPEDLLTAMFESKDDLPDDELPRRHDKVPQQQDKAPQKQDKSPQKQVEDVQSSTEDLLTAMFESKDDLPEDEIPPEQRHKSKQKDTQPKQPKKIPSPPPPPPLQVTIEEPEKTPDLPTPEQWKCAHCYFMNMHGANSCNFCKQARGTAPDTPIPQSIPRHASLATMDGSIAPTSQWQQDQHAQPDKDVFVISTGVTMDKAQEVIDAVTASGLTMHFDDSDEPKHMDAVTHVVTHRNTDGLSGRTAKYLAGILKGVWIVDIAWLVDSSKAKQWLPEQRYEVLGDTVTGVTHGPRRGRMRKNTEMEPLFHGIKFNFFDKAHPMRDKLMKLCRMGGGKVLLRRPPADKSGAARDHDVERSTINPQYPVIIITDKKQLEKKSARGLQLYQVRESQWLLDRISKCSLAT